MRFAREGVPLLLLLEGGLEGGLEEFEGLVVLFLGSSGFLLLVGLSDMVVVGR